MDIEKELGRLSQFLPKEALLEKVSPAIKILPEPITHVLPSTVLAKDGLALMRVLLVTDRYLCEVAIAGAQAHAEFDVIAKSSVQDYRFKIWTHEIKVGEAVEASYEVAEITLLHGIESDFTTDLTYAGRERADWLSEVLEAVPVSVVLRSDR